MLGRIECAVSFVKTTVKSVKTWIPPLLAMLAGALVVGLALGRGCTQSLGTIRGRADMVSAGSDAELAVAVKRAKSELPRFIAALEHPAAGQHDFAVNARFTTNRGPEQIWVRVESYGDRKFEGHFADEPLALIGKHKGDPVTVPEADVSDWVFKNGEKIAGGYTMQVLLKRQR